MCTVYSTLYSPVQWLRCQTPSLGLRVCEIIIIVMMGLSWLEWDMEFLVGHDFGIHLRYRKLFKGSITYSGRAMSRIYFRLGGWSYCFFWGKQHTNVHTDPSATYWRVIKKNGEFCNSLWVIEWWLGLQNKPKWKFWLSVVSITTKCFNFI